jgi:predicted lipoprotein with Yx(FWY)xxD motif
MTNSQEESMTSIAKVPDPTRRRLGGVAALFASAAIIAACSSQAGAATNAPAGTTAPAGGAITLTVATNATLGSYIAGKDGMSLYLFMPDTGTTSTCTGNCAGTWPPLTVTSASDVTAGAGVTGAIGTTARADGTTQVTINGHPVYYYSGDSKAGDTSGQGKFNKWYLLSPAGDGVGMAAATTAPAATSSASKCSGPTCY